VIEYWTVDLLNNAPSATLLELASMHTVEQRKVLLFRDRFNALKAARMVGSSVDCVYAFPGTL
jgi:hypothetical protein